MKTKSIAEMLENIDAGYLTEAEKYAAIARAERAEYVMEAAYQAGAWMKAKFIAVKDMLLASHNHSHA